MGWTAEELGALNEVDFVALIEELKSIGSMARVAIDTGGREEFDPRGVEDVLEMAAMVIGQLELALDDVRDAARSFRDESGDEVAGQVILRVNAAIGP